MAQALQVQCGAVLTGMHALQRAQALQQKRAQSSKAAKQTRAHLRQSTPAAKQTKPAMAAVMQEAEAAHLRQQ